MILLNIFKLLHHSKFPSRQGRSFTMPTVFVRTNFVRTNINISNINCITNFWYVKVGLFL